MTELPEAKYMAVVEDCILVAVGNDLNDRDKGDNLTLHAKFHYKVRKYISKDRFNSDFRNEIKNRERIFSNFSFKPINATAKDMLLARFPEVAPAATVLEQQWNRLVAIRLASRYTYLPTYIKWYNAKKRSSNGHSVNDGLVLENMWSFFRKEEIKHQLDTHRAKKKEEWNLEKINEGVKPYTNAEGDMRWQADFSHTHSGQSDNWQDDLPCGFAAFVLAGKPGLNLTSMDSVPCDESLISRQPTFSSSALDIIITKEVALTVAASIAQYDVQMRALSIRESEIRAVRLQEINILLESMGRDHARYQEVMDEAIDLSTAAGRGLFLH